MAFKDALIKLGSKIKGLFTPKMEVSLSHLQETGEKTMQYSGRILGKNDKFLARVEQYTQPVQSVGSNGRVLANTSVRSRKYIPEAGTPLKNLGVNWVETTLTPYGRGLMAQVKTSNGKIKELHGHTELRNYVRLMK